ncbi:MAG: TonB-dependent receptor, partial [Deltaproteobacteria bacterium]
TDSYGRIKLDYSPDKDYDLSLSVYNRASSFRREDTYPDYPAYNSITIAKENSYGIILKPVWRHSERGVLSTGVEASYGKLDLKINDLNPLDKDRDVEKKAAYANESYGIGDLDVNIGARYDDDSVFGSEFSPSLGAVYHLGKNVLVRANASRGFTPPPLTDRYFSSPYVMPNPDLKAERSWSYQAGMESEILHALTAKVTFYRADITDAISVTPIDPNDPNSLYHFKNFNKFRREGVEVEARTTEYKGLSLSYGYAFNDVRNMDTDTIVEGKARVTHDVGIDYRGPYETKSVLKGHYIYWNAPASYNAKDNTFIWDAKVSKYLAKWKGVMGELFASVHNVTDEKQFLMDELPNPGRWVEGGVSLTFY